MKNLISIIVLLVSVTAQAPWVTIISGNIKSLKGQQSINVEFIYEHAKVGPGLTEEDYLASNKQALNKKEAGRGDKWEEAWFNARKERFEPQFLETFAKHAKLSVSQGTADYTLIFKATRYIDDDLLIMSGRDTEATKTPAHMDAKIFIVKTQNRNDVVAELEVSNVPGRLGSPTGGAYAGNSSRYDVKIRLGLTYAKAGAELGTFISRGK